MVKPRLNGDRITLDIRTARAGPGRLPEQQSSATRVVVEPGTWVPLGGSTDRDTRQERGILRRRSTGSDSRTGIFVKVDRLP